MHVERPGEEVGSVAVAGAVVNVVLSTVNLPTEPIVLIDITSF